MCLWGGGAPTNACLVLHVMAIKVTNHCREERRVVTSHQPRQEQPVGLMDAAGVVMMCRVCVCAGVCACGHLAERKLTGVLAGVYKRYIASVRLELLTQVWINALTGRISFIRLLLTCTLRVVLTCELCRWIVQYTLWHLSAVDSNALHFLGYVYLCDLFHELNV